MFGKTADLHNIIHVKTVIVLNCKTLHFTKCEIHVQSLHMTVYTERKLTEKLQ